jgi:hypothetical protein
MKNNLKFSRVPGSFVAQITLIFFLASSIWAFVTPLGASPDEGAHVQYSATIIHGKHFEASQNGWRVDLPSNLANINEKELCYYIEVETPSNCYIEVDSSSVQEFNTELRVPGYPVFYYSIVGWPLMFEFSNSTWYLMRIMSVLLCTSIFGLALLTVQKIIDSSAVYALMLALTPMVSFLVGSVNPSALEITSGISISLLLAAFPQLKQKGYLGRSYWINLALITFVLWASRPYIILYIALLLVVIFFRYSTRIDPIKLLALFLLLILASAALYVFFLKTSENIPGLLIPAAYPQQIIQSQFSSLYAVLADSFSYYGWIMSYDGLKLFQTLWIALFILLVFWSIQNFSLRENISLLILSISAIALIPLLSYFFFFKNGYGFQSRYVMSIVCSVPIFSVIGNKMNLKIQRDQHSIVLIFTFLVFVSQWTLTGYRFSHGLPFSLLSLDGKPFNMWLDASQLVLLSFLFAFFILVFKYLAQGVLREEFESDKKVFDV